MTDIEALIEDYDPGREIADALREQQAEIDDATALNDRLSELLTGVANALKGEPEPLNHHGYADLPELAGQVKAELGIWIMSDGMAAKRVEELEAEIDRLTKENAAQNRALKAMTTLPLSAHPMPSIVKAGSVDARDIPITELDN